MHDANSPPALYDLTLELDANVLLYPGDEAPNIRRTSSLDAGDSLTASTFEMNCHVGTHVDAPAHFLAAGAMLSDFSVDAFMGPAVVLDLRGRVEIDSEHLIALGPAPRHHVLLRTDNSDDLRRGHYNHDHAYLTAAAADYLASLQPLSIGFDYYSVDSSRAGTYAAHRIFAAHGLLVYVCLDLGKTPAGSYAFHGLPLRLSGVEAAPVRAILHGPLPAER
jgi:arylformamidase